MGERRNPVILVAALDSSQDARDHANFVCDGTDDQVEVQGAIDALPVAPLGGTARMLPGTYSFTENGSTGTCVLIDRSAVTLRFEPGVVVQAAGTTDDAYLFRVGTAYPGGPLPSYIERVRIEGPADLDGNLQQMGGILIAGSTRNCYVGGGMHIHGGRGAASSAEPLIATGNNIGGQPFASFWHDKLVWDNIYVSDSDEGVWPINVKDMTVRNLFVDGINNQDAFEPLSFLDLHVSNSIFKNSAGSAVDIFSSNSAVQVHDRATFIGCTFGPCDGPDLFSLAGQGGNANATFKNVSIIGCHFDMTGASMLVGLRIGHATLNNALASLIQGNTFDGTGAAAGADGIIVEATADETMILGNMISNMPGDAIRVPASHPNIQIRNNGGWGNGGGIVRATPPATSYATDNNFDP